MKLGDCYEATANALLMPSFAGGLDLPENAVLVHGRPTLTVEPFTEFGHAWIEYSRELPLPPTPGMPATITSWTCLDVANGGHREIPRVMYYRVGNVDEAKCLRYTRDEARAFLLSHGHYGPWEGPEAVGPHGGEGGTL